MPIQQQSRCQCCRRPMRIVWQDHVRSHVLASSIWICLDSDHAVSAGHHKREYAHSNGARRGVGDSSATLRLKLDLDTRTCQTVSVDFLFPSTINSVCSFGASIPNLPNALGQVAIKFFTSFDSKVNTGPFTINAVRPTLSERRARLIISGKM